MISWNFNPLQSFVYSQPPQQGTVRISTLFIHVSVLVFSFTFKVKFLFPLLFFKSDFIYFCFYFHFQHQIFVFISNFNVDLSSLFLISYIIIFLSSILFSIPDLALSFYFPKFSILFSLIISKYLQRSQFRGHSEISIIKLTFSKILGKNT